MQSDSPAPAPPAEPAPIGPARAFVVRTPKRTWAVPLLIGINACVYSAMVLSGADWKEPSLLEVLRFGASHGPYVAQGDWWRLLACAFVHIGFVHFMVNMASLFALRIVESFYGSGAFLLLYLLCAVTGSLSSVLWHPSVVSAGASGAIFGMAGALITFFVAHRQSIPELLFRPVLRNLIVLVALNIFIGSAVEGIDNVAHLGGLAMGVIAGRALDRDPQSEARLDRRRLLRATIPAILVGLLCVLVPWRAASASDIRIEIASDEAQRELRLGHVDAALRLAEEGLARDPAMPDLLGIRARLLILKGDPRSALADLGGLLYQRPEDQPSRFLRANVLRQLERYDEALEDALALVRANPDDLRYAQLAGELQWCLGRWSDAASSFGTVARRRGENAIEGQLFLWLARCRMGEKEQASKELRHYLSLPRIADDSALDFNLGGLFAGQTRLEQVLADFDRQGAPREQVTRLYFFAGLWRELEGNLEEARAFLRKAGEGPANDANAWLLARHELEVLEKSEKR